MKTKIIFLAIFFSPNFLYSQNMEEPIPAITYKQINSKNIKFGKYVYKQIWKNGYRDTSRFSSKNMELDSLNDPLFFPESRGGGYLNLFDILYTGITRSGLSAWEGSTFNEYETIMTVREIDRKIEKVKDKIFVGETVGVDTEEITTVAFGRYITSYEIQELRLYDYNDHLIQKKTVGISPVIQFYSYKNGNKIIKEKQLFWIYYPEFKKIAVRTYINSKSCSGPLALDNFLAKQKYFGIDQSDTNYIKDNYFSLYYSDLYVNIKYLQEPPYKDDESIVSNITFSEKPKVSYPYLPKKYKKAEIAYIKIRKENNYPLFKPSFPIFGYISMIDLLLWKQRKSLIIAYSDDDLTKEMTVKEVEMSLAYPDQEVLVVHDDTTYTTIIEGVLYSYEVTSYILKELRFRDKGGNIIAKRILAISPVRQYYKKDDINRTKPVYEKAFWIKYSDFEMIANDQDVTKLSPLYFINDFYDKLDTIYKMKEKGLFTPMADKTINEFLISGESQGTDIKVKEISKQEIEKIIKQYGILK